jgi:hypothetical protein
MTLAGGMELLELAGCQLERPSLKRPGELGGPRSVLRIATVAETPGVVEQGEQTHDLDVGARLARDAKAVLHHPCPVGHVVDAGRIEGIPPEYFGEDRPFVDAHSGVLGRPHE